MREDVARMTGDTMVRRTVLGSIALAGGFLSTVALPMCAAASVERWRLVACEAGIGLASGLFIARDHLPSPKYERLAIRIVPLAYGYRVAPPRPEPLPAPDRGSRWVQLSWRTRGWFMTSALVQVALAVASRCYEVPFAAALALAMMMFLVGLAGNYSR